MNQGNITLRNVGKMYVPRPNLSHFKKYFLYLAPKFYNLLPNYIKECKHKNQFNKIIRNYLLNHNDINQFFTTLI